MKRGELAMPPIWAGIDAGKDHHHCVVIDEGGDRLWSRKVPNDEAELLGLLATVTELADDGAVCWAIDLNHGGAALLISVLVAHEQELLYIPGRTVHHVAGAYRGDGKTDAKDAAIIADQARMRRDLQPLRPGDEISTELRLLTGHRTDLVADRTRTFNRLRAGLLEYFPALEAAFDYAGSKAAVTLLTRYQTPDGLRRIGQARLTAWLAKQGCRDAAGTAARAIDAANRQHTTVPGQRVGAGIVAKLAADILALHDEISEVDRQIEARFHEHEHATVLLSLPGFGVLLAAEFLASTGGDLSVFESPDRLAGVAGLAPAPRDSGRIAGNHHRPRRYDRRLLRACYLAAQAAARCDPISRAFYERKRREGKNHKQAVIALARRRINVIWAMLRDHAAYRPQPVKALTAA
jgi:transposase